MSSCDKDWMLTSRSLEFPVKNEIEDRLSPSAVNAEYSDLFCKVRLLNDVSLIMGPDMEVKAEPEFFESSEGDLKYPYDHDTSVSENNLRSCKNEVNKGEESVKTYSRTGVKDDYGIDFETCKKEDEGKGRGNCGCEKTLCQESDPKTHTDLSTRKKSFVCRAYEETNSGTGNLHTRTLIHCCRDFGKNFSKEFDLKTHHKTHTEKSYKCDACGKEFNYKSHLTKHCRIHTGEKPFKCNVCDKAFNEKSNLTRHYKIHTREKNAFKCNVCDKAFNQNDHLTRHYRIHTGEKAFKCNVCGKAFTQKCSLTTHHRIHTGEKNAFKCNVCDKAFNKKNNLTRHYKFHAGERAFKCNVCGKAFILNDHLTRHYRIHTGEKAFKFNVCGKAFTQKVNLATHHRIHTGEKEKNGNHAPPR